MLLSLPWLLHLSTFVFVPDSGRGSIGVQAIGYTLDESSHGENLMNSFQARRLRLFLSWISWQVPYPRCQRHSVIHGYSWWFQWFHILSFSWLMLVDAGCQWYCQARLKDLSKHLLNDGKQASWIKEQGRKDPEEESLKAVTLVFYMVTPCGLSSATLLVECRRGCRLSPVGPGILQAHSLRDRRPARSTQGQVAKEP
jgi:hypothetical protein